jgi:hypothetical protein
MYLLGCDSIVKSRTKSDNTLFSRLTTQHRDDVGNLTNTCVATLFIIIIIFKFNSICFGLGFSAQRSALAVSSILTFYTIVQHYKKCTRLHNCTTLEKVYKITSYVVSMRYGRRLPFLMISFEKLRCFPGLVRNGVQPVP